MKLEIFGFITDTIELLEKKEEKLQEKVFDLNNFFEKEFSDKDYFLNVNHRIKSPMSLKEKILRNNYYLKYNNPHTFLMNLPDLIGVRLECRFIEDETKIYKDIVKIFDNKSEGGYYYNSDDPSILLKLDDIQPQVQKNGFEIYKVDGKVFCEGDLFKFELQIKSLVNIFWGEVEHKILYKNYNYMLMENFYRDIMSSIKGNMTMIDRQLMILHDHLNDVNSNREAGRVKQFESMLAKIIYEIYSVKIKEKLGFVVDFRNTCNLIMNYITKKERPSERGEYILLITNILIRFNEIADDSLNFDEYLSFEREIKFDNDFCSRIGTSILDVINRDFRWNMLFRIIFDIEKGNNAEDFEGFVIFLRERFRGKLKAELLASSVLENEERNLIEEGFMGYIADIFTMNIDIDFMNDDNIEKLNGTILNLVRNLKSYKQWEDEKEIIKERLFMSYTMNP